MKKLFSINLLIITALFTLGCKAVNTSENDRNPHLEIPKLSGTTFYLRSVEYAKPTQAENHEDDFFYLTIETTKLIKGRLCFTFEAETIWQSNSLLKLNDLYYSGRDRCSDKNTGLVFPADMPMYYEIEGRKLTLTAQDGSFKALFVSKDNVDALDLEEIDGEDVDLR